MWTHGRFRRIRIVTEFPPAAEPQGLSGLNCHASGTFGAEMPFTVISFVNTHDRHDSILFLITDAGNDSGFAAFIR